jgi:RES domain
VAVELAALCRTALDFHADLIRNIKSIRVSQDLFDDLADSLGEIRIAQAAEGARRIPSAQPMITRPFDYGTVISYSFETAHWQESRYSDGREFGVWYGAIEMRTSVYETIFHWHRFLLDSFPEENRDIVGERRLFDVRCDALLIDARQAGPLTPRLTDRKSYAFTHNLGRYLKEQQQNGLLAPSARCEGSIAAILNPGRLSNVRDKAQLIYRCNPTRDRVTVERTPRRTWFSVAPSTLY